MRLSVLHSERHGWIFLAFLLGGVTVLKGLRIPGLWSATQAQLNYSAFGFIKRGAFGQLMLSLGIYIGDYSKFALVSFILLFLFLILIVFVAISYGMARHRDGLIASTVFFSSFAVVFLIHLVGYLDIPLAILSVACLLSLRVGFYPALLVMVCLSSYAILIHEIYSIVFLPPVLFAFFARAMVAPHPSRRIGFLVLSVCFLLGVVVWVSWKASLSPDQMVALKSEVQGRVNFPVREDFFEVLGRSGKDNLNVMIVFAFQKLWWWLDQLRCLVLFGPTMGFLLFVAARRLRRSYGARAGWVIAAAVFMGVAPLLANVFAWDVYRWWAMATLSCFLILLSSFAESKDLRDEEARLSPAVVRVAVLMIILNMASSDVGLMDGYSVNLFPFSQLARDAVGWVRGGFAFAVPLR